MSSTVPDALKKLYYNNKDNKIPFSTLEKLKNDNKNMSDMVQINEYLNKEKLITSKRQLMMMLSIDEMNW